MVDDEFLPPDLAEDTADPTTDDRDTTGTGDTGGTDPSGGSDPSGGTGGTDSTFGEPVDDDDDDGVVVEDDPGSDPSGDPIDPGPSDPTGGSDPSGGTSGDDTGTPPPPPAPPTDDTDSDTPPADPEPPQEDPATGGVEPPQEDVTPERETARERGVRRSVLRDPDVARFDPGRDIERIAPGAFAANVETDAGDVEDRLFAFTESAEAFLRERRRRRLRRQLTLDLEADTGLDLDPGDVVLTEEGEDITATLGDTAQQQLRDRALQDARQDVEAELEARLGQDLEPGEDFEIVETADGVRASLTQEFLEGQPVERDIPLTEEGFIKGGTTEEGFIGSLFARGGRLLGSPVETQAPPSDVSDPRFAEARGTIESRLEEQTGVELDAEDITFTKDGNQLTGELSREGRKTVAVESAPFQDTPLEPVTEAGARADVEFDLFREENRDVFFGPIRERFPTEAEFLEPINFEEEFNELTPDTSRILETGAGIVEGVEARFNAATPDPDSAFVNVPRQAAEEVLDIDPNALGTGLVTLGAAGVVTPEPATTVGGAGVAAAGAGIVAGTAIAGTAASIQEGAPQAEASASIEELFPPEQQVPDRPVGSIFREELAIGPSSLDLPELAPPSEPIRTGRLTPPELGVPQGEEEILPPEFDVPSERPGTFGQSELDVPSVQAAGAQQVQRSRGETRSRSRTRRGVPESFIPSGDVTIGEVDPEVSIGGGGFGVRFLDDPRSLSLREIETDFGRLQFDEELTRLLENAEQGGIERGEQRNIEGTRSASPSRSTAVAAPSDDVETSPDVDTSLNEFTDTPTDTRQVTRAATQQRTRQATAQRQRTVNRVINPTTPVEQTANPISNVPEFPDEPLGPAPGFPPGDPPIDVDIDLDFGNVESRRRDRFDFRTKVFGEPVATSTEVLEGIEGDVGVDIDLSPVEDDL